MDGNIILTQVNTYFNQQLASLPMLHSIHTVFSVYDYDRLCKKHCIRTDLNRDKTHTRMNEPAPNSPSPALPQFTSDPQKLPQCQQCIPYSLLINMILRRAEPSLQHLQLRCHGRFGLGHELRIVLLIMVNDARLFAVRVRTGTIRRRGDRR